MSPILIWGKSSAVMCASMGFAGRIAASLAMMRRGKRAMNDRPLIILGLLFIAAELSLLIWIITR